MKNRPVVPLADRVDGPPAMTSADRSGTIDDKSVDVALARTRG
ncbi:hypothetical protein ACFQL4_07375 [Halosimplex aquaticum]